ncbi:SDR family NAD(P)-dependent oxidoreductase [Mycobacterium sp. NPDC050551]|uniref:SDR family NAD(P)-dependent oxidoreductase n=1 Tax=Mycobacterium sp. NPDC050551 TaxID=3155407 RepID=UPI00344A3212
MTTPFGFESTTDEVIRGVDLSGKRAVVTGATSGLGVETARALAAAGAEVVLGVRRLDAGRKIAEEIRSATGNDAIEAAPLDLSDLASVTSFAQGWNGPLHILVNNAGVMALPELQRSALGCEMQFASNFLGHFALVVALRRPLASAGGARVVSVSSTGHLFSPVVFDDLHYRFRPYDPMTAYGQSKTATVLLAVEVTARWASDGIIANALNPGAIATGLQKHTGGLRTPEEFRKTVEQGASTSVLLAASPLVDGIGGRYFENNNEAEVVAERAEDLGRAGGVAIYALDGDNAARLWREATALTQL